MRKILREFRMDPSLAEEYVERTAGMSKAKGFTFDQLSEVIKGKMRP